MNAPIAIGMPCLPAAAGADRDGALRLIRVALAQQLVEAAAFIGAVGLFAMSYVGIAISLFPLLDTGLSYWVFRGKVRVDIGYH